MAKRSAGLLLFRRTEPSKVEVLIGHMGGPFWSRKTAGAWTIPKGEFGDDEDPWATAVREFQEELGLAPPDGKVIELSSVRQAGGKVVKIFAVESDLDVAGFRSNTFEMEWPRNSGRPQTFPELDRVEWTELDLAEKLLVKGQIPFIHELRDYL